MGLTPQKASFLAYEVSRRYAADDDRRLAASLSEAKIDFNPHQISAALFALQSPFAKGVLLADEVGLGKTIEAGLLLAQRWSEGRRRLVVIAPASLTRQWADELFQKFHLPTVLLTSSNTVRENGSSGESSWLHDAVVICSYHFAVSRIADVRLVPWDLAVFDEAHRLRNCYKRGNKMGQAIRDTFGSTPKALLTATPLQNSLVELYGLMSIVDPHLFGSLDGFRQQYSRIRSAEKFDALRKRIAPYYRRVLRKDVDIRWTRRLCQREDFTSSPGEQALYDRLTEYLTKPQLFAIPRRNRYLIAMMLRKLQASSPAALAATLEKLVDQLVADAAEDKVRYRVDKLMEDEWDHFPIVLDEWDDSDDEPGDIPEETAVVWSVDEEVRTLRSLIAMAKSIDRPRKAEALLHALDVALKPPHGASARSSLQGKAVIFTESRRTQAYLIDRLREILPAEQVIAFNGTNDSERTKSIVRAWQSLRVGSDEATGNYAVDARAALVEYFRNQASVMVATEAAAEGLNLQFCNLVINYDLPWNPQRVEQRIGRCHRYGQSRDVVVMNFVDRSNAADRRVYDILADKCLLFKGVFGASDDILGALGADFAFEKRVAAIYGSCRTPAEIDAAFDELDKAVDEEIAEARKSAVNRLFRSFSPSVAERVNVPLADQRRGIREQLLQLTGFMLGDGAKVSVENGVCDVERLPPGAPDVPLGRYAPAPDGDRECHELRWGHPLVQWVVQEARAMRPRCVEVRLERGLGAHRSAGWMLCGVVAAGGASPIEEFVGVAIGDSGNPLLWTACRQILETDGEVLGEVTPPSDVLGRLRELFDTEVSMRCKDRLARNLVWHRREEEKLAMWAADREVAIRRRITEVEDDMAELRGALTNQAADAGEKVSLLRREKDRRATLAELYEQLHDTQREANAERSRVLDEMLKACEVMPTAEHLFVYRWS